MSKFYANVNSLTGTFAGWLSESNELFDDMSHIIVTVSNTATLANSSNYTTTTGNGHIEGIFSTEVMIVRDELHGGDATDITDGFSNKANLYITSNTHIGDSSIAAGTDRVNELVVWGRTHLQNNVEVGNSSNAADATELHVYSNTTFYGSGFVQFETDARFLDDEQLRFGTGDDWSIKSNGTDLYIQSVTSNANIYIRNSDSNVVFDIDTNAASLVIQRRDDNSSGPRIELRDYASSANNQYIGTILFQGADSTNINTNYATILGRIVDNTDGFEDGTFIFNTTVAGTSRNMFTLNSGGDGKARIYYANSTATNVRLYTDVDGIRVNGNDPNSVISIEAANTGQSILNFGDTDIDDVGQLLYDHTNDYLSLTVNASERMRINSDGHVGIGTSSPSRLLEVNGASGDTFMRLRASEVGAGADTIFENVVSDNTQNNFIYFGDTDDLNVGMIRYNHASNYMSFTTNAAEAMRIDSSGNVGIGTTSPTVPLQTVGTGYNTNGNTYLVSGFIQDIINYRGVSLGYESTEQRGWVLGAGTSSNLSLGTYTSGNVPTAAINIDSSGNVGIGTTTPSYTLDVNGTFNVAGASTLNGNVTLGDATADDIVFTGRVASNIVVKTNDAYDLGTSSLAWRTVYLKSNLQFTGATTNNQIVIPTNLADSLSITDGSDLIVFTTTTAGKSVNITPNTNIAGTTTIGGGYGSTGVTLTDAGVVSMNGALNVDGLASLDGGIDVDGVFTVADSTGNLTSTGTVTTTGIVTINNTTDATTTAGAIKTTGGVRIDRNLDVGLTSTLRGIVTVENTTGSSSSSTGSLIVKGGVGVAQNVHIGGTSSTAGIVYITNTTESQSTVTGAFVVSGGAGIAKDLFVGGDAVITGYLTASGGGNLALDEGSFANANITGYLDVSGDITSNLRPETDSTYSLGDSGNRWLNIYVDDVYVTANVNLQGQGSALFYDADSSNYVGFKAPSSISSISGNKVWTLPSGDGTSGQALVTNGSGVLSWAAAGATISSDTTTNTNFRLYFASSTSGEALTSVKEDSGLTYNPNTGTLTADNFAGVASSATTLTNLTSTITELNVIDGGTSATSTIAVGADRVVYNDAGTMKQVALTDLDTYFSATTKTLTNKTLTSPSIGTDFTFDSVTISAIQTSSESFADNNTSLMTSAAINDRIDAALIAAGAGDITGVTAGIGLSGGGSSGTVTLDLDFSELTDMTADISGTTEFILQNGTTESRKAANEIKLSAFNNDAGFLTHTVNADVTFNDNVQLNFGTDKDIEFYHNGTNFYTDLNTGSWNVRKSDNVNVMTLTQNGEMTLQRTGEGQEEPTLTFYHSTTSAAAFDRNGTIEFKSKDSAGTDTTYGKIISTIDDATNTSEDGSLTVQTMQSGTLRSAIVVNTGVELYYSATKRLETTSTGVSITGILTGNVTGNVTGNASTASAWQTARTLSLTGAVTGSASIDGSGNVSLNTTATNDPTLTITGDASGTATFTNLGNATLSLSLTKDPTITLQGDVAGSAVMTNLGNVTITTTVGNDSHTHDTRYVRLNTDTLFSSGSYQFLSADDGAGAGDGATLQVYQDTAGEDAYMSFHVASDYAFHFGLDGTTNDLFVGGWSMGAVKYKVWHAGNDGASSDLDADKLDGQQGSFYQNASNINAGTISDARLPATISSDITGNAATATKWATGRTIALTGDVTGTSGSFDGSGNLSFATNIAQNVVGASELNVTGNGTTAQFLRSDGDGSFTWATPTDTNTIPNNATITLSAGSGLSGGGNFTTDQSAAETITFSHSDTSTVTNLAASSRRYVTALTFDTFGHVTGYSTGTETVTDTNTTYSAGTGMSLTGTTFSIGQSVGTGNNVRFNSLGIGTAASGTAGEIRATNNITAYYSDRRLKQDITPIGNALDKIVQISGVTYRNNDIAKEHGYTTDTLQYGVIAQEVEAIMPEIVVPAPFDIEQNEETGEEYSKTGENYKTVQYEKMIPLLIEAIKELKAEIEELKKR